MASTQIPVTLLETLLYCCIAYFMIGFTPLPGPFFIFLAVNAALGLAATSIGRLQGVMSSTYTMGTTINAVLQVAFSLASGYAIVAGAIPHWMLWLYYTSPYAWALRALAINEMSQARWAYVPPGQQQTTGQLALQELDFFTDRAWIWGGLVYLLGLYLLLTCVNVWALGRCRLETRKAQVGALLPGLMTTAWPDDDCLA